MANEPKKDEAKLEAKPAELDAAKAKLEALKRKNELALVQAEIDKLENGGLTPAQVARKKKLEAVREATAKEGQPGKELAVYYVPEKSYLDGAVRDPGYLKRLPLDRLPGDRWKAVTKQAPVAGIAYRPADE